MAVLGLERFAPPPIGKVAPPPVSWLEPPRTPMYSGIDPVSGGEPVGPPLQAAPPPPTTGLFAPPGSQPSTKLVGAYTPDYAALIAGDPSMVSGTADLDVLAGRVTDARREAIRRAIVNAGLIPQGFTSADVDEATLEAARQNPFGQSQELQRSLGRSQNDLQAALAARGILASGALTGGASRLQEGYERNLSGLTNALLEAISGYEREAGDRLHQITMQRNALRNAAAERIAQDPRYRPQPGVSAQLDIVSGNYFAPDGRIYAPDGTLITESLFPAGYHGVMQTNQSPEEYAKTLAQLAKLYGR